MQHPPQYAGCDLRAGIPAPRCGVAEAAAGQRGPEWLRDGDNHLLLPHLLHVGCQSGVVPHPHGGACF